MTTNRGRNYSCALVVFAAMSSTAFGEQKAEETLKGCPLFVAIQNVDSFVEKRNSEIAETNMHDLSEETAASAKATKPGIAVGRQMTAAEIDRFNAARHSMIDSAVEGLNLSELQRNVHLISEVLAVAKLADLYETKQSDLGRDDPRQFYFKILLMLRANQPNPIRTAQIGTGMGCDPEAGLYWEEDFAVSQVAQNEVLAPQNKDLIADIERLRALYQVFFKSFSHSMDDLRATRWVGDEAHRPDSVTAAFEGLDDVTKRLYKIVVAYIDEQMPTEKALEMRMQRKVVEKAQRDNPLSGQ